MKHLFAILLCSLLLSSCKSTKLSYFDDISQLSDAAITVPERDITIQPGDELMISVTAPVPEAVAVYNLPYVSSGAATDRSVMQTQAKQQTYFVSSDGCINFPVLGEIKAEGLTTKQLAEELTRLIAKDVEAPFVRVELINFKIKVLGEVQKPGTYTINTENVNVLDALAQAGDLTVYAKRNKVAVVRKENGKLAYHQLDLSDSKTFNSPYFQLQQNDIVYAEPTQAREGQANYNQNNSYKISVISAIVSGCSVLASLIIALVINK